MANKVVLYSDGRFEPISGTANGDLLTWVSATNEWQSVAPAAASGTVTSVDVSGGTTGLTTSGGPVTDSGTITLAGTLAVGNGGTGLTSAGGVANRVVLTTDGSAFSVGAVPNAALANSSVTVTAGTGLSGGGAVSLGASTTLSLPNVGSASTYGSASQVPVFTTDAQGRVSSVTNTAIAINASAVSAIPYDFGGSVSGTPTANAEVFALLFVRAASLLATGSRANCVTAPSGGSPTFDLQLNGASIGSVAFTNGSTTGTVTITSGPVAIADGDVVRVVAPANVYSIANIRLTFKATTA